MNVVRAIAALLTLWIVLQFDRRLDENSRGLAIFLVAAFYMGLLREEFERKQATTA